MRIKRDRACAPYTQCILGVSFQSSPPSVDSDRVCTPVTECNYLQEYEFSDATIWSDRKCLPLTNCKPVGQEYILEEATETSDRVCESVDPNPCPDGSYVFKPADEYSDKICKKQYWNQPICNDEDEELQDTCAKDPFDIYLVLSAGKSISTEAGCMSCMDDLMNFVATLFETTYCERTVGALNRSIATQIYVSSWSSNGDWDPNSPSFYGSEHTVHLDLTDNFNEVQFVLQSMAKMPLEGGNHPANALHAISEKIIKFGEGRRSLVVLVTNTEFGSGTGAAVASARPQIKSEVVNRAEVLKEIPGVQLATVGIGAEIDTNELSQLSSSLDLAMVVPDFKNLPNVVPNLVLESVACIELSIVYIICPSGINPLQWNEISVHLQTTVVEDILELVSLYCNVNVEEDNVIVNLVDEDSPSIGGPGNSQPECMTSATCDYTTLSDDGVSGGNTFFISMRTSSPTTSAPVTLAPTSSRPTTSAPSTSAPTSYPSKIPTFSPSVQMTESPTVSPTLAPTYQCANARDNDNDSNTCDIMFDHWSAHCSNYVKWKECDGLCGLCPCSSALPNSKEGEHCSGHGVCEVSSCSQRECFDARCVCDPEYQGPLCSELAPTQEPTLNPTQAATHQPTFSPTESGTGQVTVLDANSACSLVQIKIDPDASSFPSSPASGCRKQLYVGTMTAYFCEDDEANGVATCEDDDFPRYVGSSPFTKLALQDSRLNVSFSMDRNPPFQAFINNRAVYQYGCDWTANYYDGLNPEKNLFSPFGTPVWTGSK